ncbi:MAG: hypothetical protein AAFQ37_08200 [Bacteroidota bacterium]
MKKVLFFIGTLFFTLNLSAQFSLGAGLSLPIGSYADEEEGAASIGFVINSQRDWAINDVVGFTSKGFFGLNSVDTGNDNVEASPWMTFGGGAGLYVSPAENFRFNAIVLYAYSLAPKIEAGGQEFLSRAGAGAVGFDIGARYMFERFYIGVNFTTSTPTFTYEAGSSEFEIEQSVGYISIGGGFIFD